MECRMNNKNRLFQLKIFIIFLLLIFLVPTTISENSNEEYYVDSNYRGYSTGTAEQPFKSIQTAIDEAESGDTIYVFGGLYEEIITIGKQLNLWGGVEGTESIIKAKDDIRYTMKITADHVEIQDFTFCDSEDIKNSPIGALISIQAENVVITGNSFHTSDSYGIQIDESAAGAVVNGNTINNTNVGIIIESSNTNDIFNNKIFNCEDTGIILENTDENRLYENTIYDCSKGILASYSSALNITNNTVYEMAYAGILVENCQQVTIQNNEVYDNPAAGLYLQSDYCTIRENNFENNQRGITLTGNNNIIHQNQISSCTGSGLFAQITSKQNTIYNNTFQENGKNAEDNGNNNWYQGEFGNYWDDYNWIDLDHDGVGDREYQKNGIADNRPLGFFLKPPNKPSNPSPSDASSGVGLKVTLKVKIIDKDSDSIDVTFYNAENNKKIGEEKKVTSGKYSNCEITLPFNNTYAWYVHVTDGIQENISNTFFFTTMVTPPDNEPPVADGGGLYYGEAGVPISFDASGSSDTDGEIDFYRWNFGDGTSELLAKQPIHTYQQDGTYKVTLTVIDNLGATDTITFSVPIGVDANNYPIADPGGPYQGMVKEIVVFDGTNSTDIDGIIAEYMWDFGDGTTGTGSTITHKYSSSGSYMVTLTVADNYGDSHAESTVISITAAKEPDGTPGFEFILFIFGLIIAFLEININRKQNN